MLKSNFSNISLILNLEFFICSSLYPWSSQSSFNTLFSNWISAGASSSKFAVIEFLSDKALDNTQIVTNNIKEIIVIENTVVFILLLNCLNVKVFNPFTYKFFILVTIFKISPDKDQNIKNVDTAPITIGLNISSGGLIVSFIPPVTI